MPKFTQDQLRDGFRLVQNRAVAELVNIASADGKVPWDIMPRVIYGYVDTHPALRATLGDAYWAEVVELDKSDSPDPKVTHRLFERLVEVEVERHGP